MLARGPGQADRCWRTTQLVQIVGFSSMAGVKFYANTAVVLVGTNVYTIDNLEGANDPISASLLGNLINRVQALYKHH